MIEKKQTKNIWFALPILFASLYLTFFVDQFTLDTFGQRLLVFVYFCVMTVLAVILKRKKFISNKKQIVSSLLLSAVIVALFWNTFIPTKTELPITLTALPSETGGGEVWLTELSIDGVWTPLSELQVSENSGWLYHEEYDDFIYYPPDGQTAENTLCFSVVGREAELTFAYNSWSGAVAITDSTENGTTLNLHTTDEGQAAVDYYVTAPSQGITPKYALLTAGAVVVIAYFVSFLVWIMCVELDTEEKKWERRTYFCSIVHWLSSFVTDKFIFQYDVASIRFKVLKFCYLFVLIGIWHLIFYTIRKVKKKDPVVIKSLQFFAGFWMIFTVIMLCIWPGNWVWDDIFVFEFATTLRFEAWQHILTSIVYIFSMMLLPCTAGVVIVQYTVIAAIIGSILGSCYVRLKNKKRILWMCLPFLFPPVLAHIFYPMRLVLYSFIILLMVFRLLQSKSAENWSIKEYLILIGLHTIVIWWRSEGIVIGAVLIIAVGFVIKNRKIFLKYTSGLICLVIILNSVQNYYADASGRDSNYYGVTSYMEILDDLVKYEATVDPDSEIMQTLRECIDVDLLLECETGERAFFDNGGAFSPLLENKQYDLVKQQFFKLVLKHPIITIKERINFFLAISAMTSDSIPFVTPNSSSIEILADYPMGKILNEKLRESVLGFLVGVDQNNNVTPIFYVFYNLIPSIVFMLCMLLCAFKKRDFVSFFCYGAIVTNFTLIFAIAPGKYFMYYLPVYLCGYVFAPMEHEWSKGEKCRMRDE